VLEGVESSTSHTGQFNPGRRGMETGGLVGLETVWKFRRRENLLLLPRFEPLSVQYVA
jgi:hypothetical protein